MSKIKLTLPNGESPATGKQVTFKAPCDCTQVTHIQINGVDCEIVDPMGEALGGKNGYWASGSLVSVILDISNQKVYVQSAAISDYGNKYADIDHNHDDEYSSISHNHDDKYATVEHGHGDQYADARHNHDGKYAPSTIKSTRDIVAGVDELDDDVIYIVYE